jgi:hypothetical protein
MTPDVSSQKNAMSTLGMRSAEHKAKELLLRITCDLLELSAKTGTDPVTKTARKSPEYPSVHGGGKMFRIATDRSGAMSALPGAPSITIVEENLPSPANKHVPWGATSSTGNMSRRKKRPMEWDFLCGQISSSPIAGFPVHAFPLVPVASRA